MAIPLGNIPEFLVCDTKLENLLILSIAQRFNNHIRREETLPKD